MDKETGRLEAFSDGVFAIAITLLVLELKVPLGTGLARQLLDLWPSYVSFALSFVTILIMWVNHHASLHNLEHADARVLFANGFLLLTITFVPFPTAVLAAHLGNANADARMAAAFYAGTYVLINLAWGVFWASIVSQRHHVAPLLGDDEVRAVNRSLVIGFTSYLAATALAIWSGVASIALCMLVAVFWIVQGLRRHEAVEQARHGRAA
jgi:uncharacterized membrane protein